MIQFDKFTQRAQDAICRMQELSEQEQHQILQPFHLLVALVEEENGVVPAVLNKLSIPAREVSERGTQGVREFPEGSGIRE